MCWFPYTMLLALPSRFPCLKIFEELLLCSRHVLRLGGQRILLPWDVKKTKTNKTEIPSLLSLFLRRRIRRFKWRSHFAASNIATRAVVMEHLPMQLARQEQLALLIEAAFHEKQRIRGENFFPAPFAPKDDSHIRISRSFSFLLQLHYPRALCSSMLELLS